jgi:hypothetical protein
VHALAGALLTRPKIFIPQTGHPHSLDGISPRSLFYGSSNSDTSNEVSEACPVPQCPRSVNVGSRNATEGGDRGGHGHEP